MELISFINVFLVLHFRSVLSFTEFTGVLHIFVFFLDKYTSQMIRLWSAWRCLKGTYYAFFCMCNVAMWACKSANLQNKERCLTLCGSEEFSQRWVLILSLCSFLLQDREPENTRTKG